MRRNLVIASTVMTLSSLAGNRALAQMLVKTETFDSDPGWDGHNNRAQTPEPRRIVQNFGYSATSHAGGPAGEIGGFITPAGEAAYYAKVIPQQTFNDPFSVSGKLNVAFGGGHTLIGLFNSNTINEWRTPNALSLRIYGRDDYFYAFPEYGTAKWRANQTSFPGSGDEFHFSTGSSVHNFTLQYDPTGNSGNGLVTASIDGQTASMSVPPGHRADGAIFNRFGFLNVMKSADGPGSIWLDDLVINGQLESFSANPNWSGLRNVGSYTTTDVRPRFDFGYSNTNHAGGAGPGEIGGQIFRGDSNFNPDGRYMAYYGDRLGQTLDLSHPLHASGKVAFRRGVSDSATLIGFFHSTESIRVGPSDYMTPENFVGAAIEGPSSEGFYWYPTFNTNIEDGHGDGNNPPPYIYPNGDSHNWTLDYDPSANNGFGMISLSLDGQVSSLNLTAADRSIGAHFNRFGIITTHVDGLGQTVYFDDLTYTFAVPEPATISMLAAILGVSTGCRRRTPNRFPLGSGERLHSLTINPVQNSALERP
jgi:hypothetical protein